MAEDVDPTIVVNGEARACPARRTVGGLLAELGHDPRSVAVEHNGRVLRRAELVETPLSPGDRVEIVRFVQGGGRMYTSRLGGR